MQQRIICIIAGQRAGTTALQHAMHATGAVRNYGEIFQTRLDRVDGDRHTFVSFVRQNNIALSDTIASTGAAIAARQYLDWLREGAGSRHVLIDVKLNAWSALSPAWRYPHEEPFFLARLKEERAVLLLVWRKNLAEQVLSLFIARELGIWHNLSARRLAGRTITAPIKQLERLSTLICRSESDMNEHLQDYSDKISIAYEDLYRDGELTESFKFALHAQTGIELSLRPLRIRPNVSKRDIVTNYEEAAAAISAIAAKYRLT